MNIDKAKQAYRDFRGMEPGEVIYTDLPGSNKAFYHMGDVSALEYDTVRDGDNEYYRHDFPKWARPSLNASEDGKELILTGWPGNATERGLDEVKRKSNPLVAIVNPHKRGDKKKGVTVMAKTKTKRKAPAKKAATTAARTREVIVYQPNPVTPLRRKKRRTAVAVPKVKVKRRRNPSRHGFGGFGMGGKGSFNPFSLIMPGIMQATGAVVTDIVTTLVPLPDNFKTGPMKGLANMAIGVGIGLGVAKFVSKKAGMAFAEGAIVIGGYNLIRGFVASKFPQAGLNGYMPDGMGGFVAAPGLDGYAGARSGMSGFVPSPGFNGVDDDDDGMGMFTSSMVYPDQDNSLSTLVNR